MKIQNTKMNFGKFTTRAIVLIAIVFLLAPTAYARPTPKPTPNRNVPREVHQVGNILKGLMATPTPTPTPRKRVAAPAKKPEAPKSAADSASTTKPKLTTVNYPYDIVFEINEDDRMGEAREGETVLVAYWAKGAGYQVTYYGGGDDGDDLKAFFETEKEARDALKKACEGRVKQKISGASDPAEPKATVTEAAKENTTEASEKASFVAPAPAEPILTEEQKAEAAKTKQAADLRAKAQQAAEEKKYDDAIKALEEAMGILEAPADAEKLQQYRELKKQHERDSVDL